MTVMDIPSASLYEEAAQADRIKVGPVNIEPVQLSVIHELPQIRQEYDQSGLEELARSIVLNPGALEQHVKNGDYEAASQALDLSHPLILNRLDESHIDQYLADHAKYYDLDTKWRIAAGDDTSVLVLVSGHRRRRALELIAKQYDFALDRLYVRSTIGKIEQYFGVVAEPEADVCVPRRIARPAMKQTVHIRVSNDESQLQPIGSLASLEDLEDVEMPAQWQDRALCAQVDSEMFFPEKGGSTREAKSVCARCEVKDECLSYALENGERFGIWGGLSERERRRLQRGIV